MILILIKLLQFVHSKSIRKIEAPHLCLPYLPQDSLFRTPYLCGRQAQSEPLIQARISFNAPIRQ